MPASRVMSVARAFLCMAVLFGARAIVAKDEGLPPRAEWRASASSIETPAMATAFGIDGDRATRWGGGFSAGHWYRIDFGRAVSLGGAMIAWDSGFARAFSLQMSDDGETWRTVYETRDGLGGTEYHFFPESRGRYLRIVAPERTADWGVSIFEFDPIAAREAPRMAGLMGRGDAATVWQSSPARPLLPGKTRGTRELRVDLPRALQGAGLEVFWSQAPAQAQLYGRDAKGEWILLRDDRGELGASSYLAADTARDLSALRVVAVDVPGKATAITRLRLLGPTRVMTPMKRYEIAATRANAALFPNSLRANQVYWTTVGIPGGRQKSVFDEYGNLEAFKTAPLVQPIWRDASGVAVAAFDATLTHRLREGWMPMPAVAWSPMPGLTLTSEAIAIEQRGAPVTLVRHRLSNTSDREIVGSLSLVTRPMQISPPWQNGGPSPIRDIAIDHEIDDTAVRVNGRVLFHSLTAPTAAGAAPFGEFGEHEITAHAAAGTAPEALTAHDEAGLAAALLRYDVKLAPGAQRDIVIAFALGDARFDPNARRLPPSPALDRAGLGRIEGDPGKTFDVLADELATQWRARLGGFGLNLPDRSLVDMLRAQGAYMLINQSGPAMQPGPRNYNRSFIRDGSATAAVLARMGMASTARDYLKWYAAHAVHDNGLVSPILNDDGSVNTGFGSDIEHDSQGQFIWLVAEIARLDGGAKRVREYEPQVKRAMKFLQELRERTLVPGYQADREAPERFRGLLAPSISHEGYSTPTHSYWDDYWGLRGWRDGAWLAEQWGDRETASWAREQYAALRDSLAASIKATIAWQGGKGTMPASADLGDGDPTSVSIGLDPGLQQDIMPPEVLARSFEKYLNDVRRRDQPDALYAYTPYEMRNVLTYVHLDQPREAEELLMNLVRHRRPPEWQVLAEVVYSDLRHAIYLGDMPHTWIGAEYARAIFGMLMFEADDHLSLLPGTPPSWVAGEGLRVDKLPTAFGPLTISARETDNILRVELDRGLRAVPITVAWPRREAPRSVLVDGREVKDFDAKGIALKKPFRMLIARW